MLEVITRNAKETKRIAELLAEELKYLPFGKAWVLALEGPLGAGKTTFVQGLAQGLGVRERVKSPTFILMRSYSLPRKFSPRFRHLTHIDCYRLDSPRELLHLGFSELAKAKDAIVVIEWAERVRKLIPKRALWVRFRHGRRPHERIIQLRLT